MKPEINLVHESTLDSEGIADARDKNHSTLFEAVEVGYKMDSNLILTHFSQRFNYMDKQT